MRKQRGFTMIEMVIVVAIVGILATIAYVQYAEFIRRTHRSDARTALQDIQMRLERWYTNRNTYVGFNIPAGLTAIPANSVPPRRRYVISYAVAPTAATFTLRAVPEGAQATDYCGTMTVNQANIKIGAKPNCWE
jgi:type IV pilus assembly protein PilE